MSSDSAGNYSLPPIYLARPGTKVASEQHNVPLEDIAQGLSERLMRDGRNGMVGDLDMGTFRIRNVSPGRTAMDALTVSQGFPIGSVVDYGGEMAPAGWAVCDGREVGRADYPELFAVLGARFGAGNGSTTFNIPDLRGRVTAGRDNMGGADAGRLSAYYGAAARTIAGMLGAASHVLTLAQTPVHNHEGGTTAAGAHNHTGLVTLAGQHSHGGTTDTQGAHSHGIPTNDNGTAGRSGVRAGTTGPTGVTQSTEADGLHSHNLQINAVGDHQHAIPTDGTHAHAIVTDSRGSGQEHPNAQPTLIMTKIIKVSL